MAKIAENRRLRIERRDKRLRAAAAKRALAKVAIPHVGLAAYFTVPPSDAPVRAAQIAELLIDRSTLAMAAVLGEHHGLGQAPGFEVGSHRRRRWGRVAGRCLRLNRTAGDNNFVSVALSLNLAAAERGDSLTLWITCKSVDVPKGKSFAEFLTLAHDLVVAVGADHATLGAWPTYNQAIGDTWLTRMILDTPGGETNLGLPADFDDQISLIAKWRHLLGRTYARHPRWGTYLHARHLAAIGGVEKIHAVVNPARIDSIGTLTYIQLTDAIDSALTAEAGVKRQALQTLMAPILLGAPIPVGA